MNSIEQTVELQELEDRIATYGPIPRQVFNVDRNYVKATLESRIASFDYSTVRRMGLMQSAYVPKDFDGMSWWVLHVTTENLRQPSKILWASTWVMQQVLSRYT